MRPDPTPSPAAPSRPAEGGRRRPSWWAWPLIGLVPLFLWGAQHYLPAAEAESQGQQDLSLLAVLQFQSKVVIAMDGLPEGRAREQLHQLEGYVRSDGTAAALAAMHGFLGLEDGGREGAALILARRRQVAGVDAAFLESVGRAVNQGVDEAGRRQLRERMGWFADLFGVPGDPARSPLGEQIRSEAMVLVMVTGLVGFGAVLAIFTGAGLLLLAGIRIRQGRWSPVFQPNQEPAAAFLEAFAIFLAAMALGNVGGWLVHGMAQPVVTLAGLVLSLSWPRIRGCSGREARLALGWHRGRGFWREVGAGVVGYLAVLPMALIGLAVTLVLVAAVGAAESLGAVGESASRAGGGGGAAAPEPVTHPAVGWMLGGWEAKVLVFGLAAVLAPVVEETFFRGAFYRYLRSRWGMPAAGVLNGLIFAALHPQGWMAIPALTAMGFGFACLREWRDSLIAPMTAHAINNGLLIGGLALALS